MQNVLFIVNPISGNHPERFKEDLLTKNLDSEKFSYEIYNTEKEGDGYTTVKDRLEEFDGFIAVGGDGTVNEVFRGMLDSEKWFTVIPNGSGNGLARSMNIPMNLAGAIKNLNKAKVQPIDYALINGEPFINVSGIGIDARIASKFSKSTRRGFRTYAEITLQEFQRMKTQRVKIKIKGKSIRRRILLASFANSSQFGNNAHIAPKAKLNDGLLHIITMKRFHWLSVPYLTWLLFNRALDRSKLYREHVVTEATITTKKKIHLHIDGEERGKVKKIHLKIVPGGVNILA